MASWKNRPKASELFKKLPPILKQAMAVQLKSEVTGLVDAMRRAAPVSDDLEKTPGQFRDSIHEYENPSRELSYRIVADAKDVKGAFIGPHIEFGHLARDGSHVPPKPSFFPTYRAWKRPMRRRMNAAARGAVKRLIGTIGLWGGEGNG
ncbi:MAG: hypothetical protein P4L73_13395 [Caulobacteraceae bacterium]|nr:hypothetical protein [Caulobacteraceae bacterium]